MSTYTTTFARSPDHFQEPVIAEKAEIDTKLAVLSRFINEQIFMNLPLAERGRLIHQHNLMEALSAVLGDRIAAFQESN